MGQFDELEAPIALILYRLETIFPPAFFRHYGGLTYPYIRRGKVSWTFTTVGCTQSRVWLHFV